MIFVTLGTQKQQFTRILDYIEKSNLKDEIIVQNGNTKYKSKKMELIGFISYDEIKEYIKKADIIISHGGLSIIDAIKLNKKVICCPRDYKYKEHINNHQFEMNKFLKDKKCILMCTDYEEFEFCLKKIKTFSPKKIKDNSDVFFEKLKDLIDLSLKKDNLHNKNS